MIVCLLVSNSRAIAEIATPFFDFLFHFGLLRLIAAHSPMSWAHINMLGEYDFSEEKLRDTLGILPPKKAA